MNQIALAGNVGPDLVLRHTDDGIPIADISLVTRRIRDRTDSLLLTTECHRLVIWGEAARIFVETVRRGDLIEVRGSLRYRLRESAGGTVQEAVICVLEWSKLASRKALEDSAADAAGAGRSIETEIEGASCEWEQVLAIV